METSSLDTTLPHNNAFRLYLMSELEKRVGRNPKFSLRAFARMLQIEASSLSQILNGKRKLTDSMCLRLGQKLGLSPDELNDLMDSGFGKNIALKAANYRGLSPDQFKIIADWYHYAILELTHLSHFTPNIHWVAKVLNISIAETQAAVDRLVRCGYMDVTPQGRWIDTSGDITTTNSPFTTSAFRKLQKHVLEKAIIAMEEISMDRRSQTSMTVL